LIQVSAELDPDASGLYEQGADYDGHRTWSRQGGGWFLWYSMDDLTYALSTEIGNATAETDRYWINYIELDEPHGTYNAQGTESGDAVVTDFVP